MKKRDSNYELMRIVSMFLIVLFHVIHHSNALLNSSIWWVSKVLEFIEFLTLVHVNSFILVTGYYQCEAKFKMSKVLSLFFTSLFYILLVILLFSCFNIHNFTSIELFNELNFFESGGYWFIKYYLVLYILSPFYNIIINYLSKKKFIYLLVVIILLLGVIPWLTGSRFMYNNGFSIIQFSLMYFIGAYLKKYPLQLNMTLIRKRLLLIFIIFTSTLLNYCSYKFLSRYMGINPILDLFNNSIIGMNTAYNNGFIMISSVCYFLLFGTFKFSNKIVDNVSKLVFGVYLIHDNTYVRAVLYTNVFRLNELFINSRIYILYVLWVALVIFVVCLAIDFIRSKLFNLIGKIKYIDNKKKKLDEWFMQFS